MIYLLIVIIALTLIINLTLFVFFIVHSFCYRHDITSHPKAIFYLHEIIKQNQLTEKSFVDLGCAWGSLSFQTKNKYPNLNIIAIDNSYFRIFICKLLNFLKKRKIKFIHQNIYSFDFSKADIFYSYLWYTEMEMLEKKFLTEAKPQSLLITNDTSLPNLKPKKIITLHTKKQNSEKIFVYKKQNLTT